MTDPVNIAAHCRTGMHITCVFFPSTVRLNLYGSNDRKLQLILRASAMSANDAGLVRIHIAC